MFAEFCSNPWCWGPISAVVLLFVLAHLKTSRPDGVLEKVHPYRRMVPFIMRSRNESVVYFDGTVRAEKMEAYLAQAKAQFGANVTHIAVAAANIALGANPRLNRFVSGRRIYRRKGRWVTFSMKRQKKNARAKLGVVKLEMTEEQSFRKLVERINGKITHERSGEKTSMDTELQIFGMIPRTVMRLAYRAFLAVDYVGLLPKWFLDGDGMFTSIFMANLGSVEMGPGYHHLYEWGNAPLFVMIGQVEERPVVENGEVVVGRVLPVRFSYDERIDDGITARGGIEHFLGVLGDPEKWLGGLDGSADLDPPMWPRQDAIETA